MSQLIIDDLNFCNSCFPSKNEVKGGVDTSVSLDTSVDTAQNTTIVSFFDPSSGSYFIAGSTSGATAGATAGALATDGFTFATTFSVAGAF